MKKNKNKVLGALLGVAAGDALGAPLEFMSAAEIRAKHCRRVREMVGGGWLNMAPGEVTDDTQMTLAVAEGIAESPGDPIPAIGRRFIEWYDSKPKDIGNCCRAAIAYAKAEGAGTKEGWHNAARRVDKETGGKTAGNGALMRTVYASLYYSGSPRSLSMAMDIGRMTHIHKDSDLAIFVYSNAIEDIIGEDKDVYRTADICVNWGKERIEGRMGRVFKKMKGKTIRPDGYVLNSLMCAVNAIGDTDSFEDAVVQAVNLGGDADTIGAITGGLAGALYGAKAIPQRWLDALDGETVRQITRLAELASGHIETNGRE